MFIYFKHRGFRRKIERDNKKERGEKKGKEIERILCNRRHTLDSKQVPTYTGG